MSQPNRPKLSRQMGLMALTATGVCSMLGASINVVPFMIQRNVPGIGPYVLPAFAFAAIPAIFAALAYAILSSAMPRAGGSYIYVSRGLNPYLGFVASFSQWFGLSIVIGVIAYLCIPFLRDISLALGWENVSLILGRPFVRVSLALFLIWYFVWINIKGAKSYQSMLLPMMFLSFALGAIVIVTGFTFNSQDFTTALKAKENRIFQSTYFSFDWRIFFSASALLFSSFIGFDSISQAGSEAKNPTNSLPKAILLAVFLVSVFYFLFTGAVYHTVPWSFVAAEAAKKDISAPGLLSYVIPKELSVAILLGASIALINDLPAMLLSVSRLMFAWAEDGIFPAFISRIHPKKKTPYIALAVGGLIASLGVLGAHFAGDFFLGIDIMVTSMLINFLLICIALIWLPKRNPLLADQISVVKNRRLQLWIGWLGSLFLTGFLIINIYKDMTAQVTQWFFHSTLVWIIVMALASYLFFVKWSKFGQNNPKRLERFKVLPEE